MNKLMVIKVLSLIAAFASGAVSIVGGDLVTGLGVIAASLTSANLIPK